MRPEPAGAPARWLAFPGLGALGLPHATTTRHAPAIGGPSAPDGPFPAEAVTLLAGAGLDLRRAAWARQVHGADVLRAGAPGLAGTADGLATTERGLPLAVFTADCLAIVLWDPAAGALACAHVGWRGTVRGTTGAAVAALAALGGRAARCHAAIAPSIGPCCYEVDAPVVEAFAAAFGERWRAWATPRGAERWMLDLWRANEDLLADAGVPAAQVENARLCTGCHADLLHSYRRGTQGRLVTVAALP